MYNKTKIEATSQYKYVTRRAKRKRGAAYDFYASLAPRSERSLQGVSYSDYPHFYAHDYPFY